MSADKWSVCPRCLHRARAKAEMELAAVMATYGTAPVEEFDAARTALQPVDEDDYVTLREDYEFYNAATGEVAWDYSCGCSVCGLATTLTGSKRFWSESEET